MKGYIPEDRIEEIRGRVIMISALDQESSVARCLEAGAEDYVPKPFNSVLLRARIGASLEKRHLRETERRTYEALVRSQEHLAAELAEAAAYIKSLLPPPLSGPVEADWCFQPSAELGGDAFGYHWLDSDHLAIYLLDVCGHGVGSALLGVSAMNSMRSGSLSGTDMRDPTTVLKIRDGVAVIANLALYLGHERLFRKMRP